MSLRIGGGAYLRTRAASRTAAWVVTATLFAIPALGFSECESSTPDAACDTECDAGEVLVCGNVCVTPRNRTASCNPNDPCAANGLCAEGLTCTRVGTIFSPKQATCRDLGQTLWTECSLAGTGPDHTDVCANNLYCRDNVTCGATDDFFDRPRCMDPVTQEGGLCDSNIDDPECAPCAPGLSCIEGYCLRGCAADTDCACPDGGDSPECYNGKCHLCSDLGENCDDTFGYTTCCDGSQCGGNHKCCWEKDASHQCDSLADCCGGAGTTACAPNSPGGADYCKTCLAFGSNCFDDSQCCGGMSCNGKCIKDCHAGDPCTVDGAKGPCAVGLSACDPVTGDWSCVSSHSPAPDNTCDGIDDNCDGHVDEDVAPVGATCSGATAFYSISSSGTPNEQECANADPMSSHPLTAPGHLICVDHQEVCAAVNAPDFSKWDFCYAADGTNHCGEFAANSCDSSNLCAPGMKCFGAPPSGVCQVDSACGPYPANLGWCWLPSDVGQCPW